MKKEADAYYTAAFFMNLLIWLVCQVLCTVFMEDLAWILGGTEETMPYIMDYILYYMGNGSCFLSCFFTDLCKK